MRKETQEWLWTHLDFGPGKSTFPPPKALSGRNAWNLWVTTTEERPRVFCGEMAKALCQSLPCPGAGLSARVESEVSMARRHQGPAQTEASS